MTRHGMAPTAPVRWQASALMREYADVPPAACRCAWSHFSDYGGWCRTTTRRECPIHGHAAADRTPVEAGGAA